MTEVLTVEEVAQKLRATKDEVMTLVESGELRAFRVGASPRIAQAALEEFMSRPYAEVETDGASVPSARKTLRERVRAKVLIQRSDARFLGSYKFEAGNKVGFIRTASTTSGLQHDYWFGFQNHRVAVDGEVYLIYALPTKDVVLPYSEFRELFKGMSQGKKGSTQFHLEEVGDEVFLKGKALAGPMRITEYVESFGQLGTPSE